MARTKLALQQAMNTLLNRFKAKPRYHVGVCDDL